MSRQSIFVILGIILVLLLAAAGGAWWYLYGPNEIASDELVPSDTVIFASLPNGAEIVTGYRTSQLKTILENPNARPLLDAVTDLLGKKNVDLLYDFLPNLSGQSFIAVTHFDYDHPEKVGLIAAMKPKTGLGDFGAFVEKLKTAYPDILKQGKTGTGTVSGVSYEWIQGPGAPDKICVAQTHGWIVTTWGEAPLADWLDRFQKKSSTPSLAHDGDYLKAVEPIGKTPMAMGYISYHVLSEIVQKQRAGAPHLFGGDLAQKFGTFGGAALGTQFENGEIVDRFSFLIPRAQQLELGLSANPCPFETLRFTGADTRFYYASSVNWKQYIQNLQEEMARSENTNASLQQWVDNLHGWAQSEGIDLQHNVIDALGSELSFQVDWPENSTYPETGLLLKVDHPDQFKPVIAAIIDTAQKNYATVASIAETDSAGQKLATLKFTAASIFSPTITEDGNFFGLFSTNREARQSFSRLPLATLDHNADFARQIGEKRSGATQLLFLDSPYLLDRAYRTALPYLPFAEMFNKDVARMASGHQLPDDLKWLAPIGTWSCVVTPNDVGVQAYSTSGIGNQGIFLSAASGGGLTLLQTMGYLSKPKPPMAAVAPSPNPANVAPPVPSSAPSTNSNAIPPPAPPPH